MNQIIEFVAWAKSDSSKRTMKLIKIQFQTNFNLIDDAYHSQKGIDLGDLAYYWVLAEGLTSGFLKGVNCGTLMLVYK